MLPTWRANVALFVWHLLFDLPSMGGQICSYTTTGIALQVFGTHKHPYHDKVGQRQGEMDHIIIIIIIIIIINLKLLLALLYGLKYLKEIMHKFFPK